MSRNVYISSVINLTSKILSTKEKNDSHSSCDSYRNIEWSKYSQTYHNLLYSNPLSEVLGVKNFLHLDGTKYKSEYKYKLNLDKILKDSLVKRPKMIWLPCIDERIQYLTASHHALSLGIPGCECLMSVEEKLQMADNIIAVCEDNPTIEEIVVSSHSKCGAVAHTLAKKSSKPVLSKILDKFQNQDKVLDSASERYASGFASILTARLQEQNSPVSVRTHHFHFQELHSKHLHHAFGAIINFNPLLNGAELEENLEVPMFNIYAGGQDAKQIMQNIELAIDIASSSEGFSCEYINQDNPFILLFAITKKDKLSMSKIQSVLTQIKDKNYPLELVYTILEG
jgi:carbonic anhydrase